MISIPIVALVAFFMNVVEIANIRKSGRRLRDTIPSITGFLLTCLVFVLLGFLASSLLKTGTWDRNRVPHCINNLKQLGLVLNMYANENHEMYPPIDGAKNNFIFESDTLFPEYLADAGIAACPSDPAYNPIANFRLRSTERHPGSSVGEVHPDCITDMNYIYLGWEVTSDEEAEVFFDIYDRLSPEDYGKDILHPEDGSVIFEPLEMGVTVCIFPFQFSSDEEYEEAVAELNIPIMWDRPYTATGRLSHQNSEDEDSPGGYVLYMDGHVEFIKFGEKFPMTETMARLLDGRPRDPIPDCGE